MGRQTRGERIVFRPVRRLRVHHDDIQTGKRRRVLSKRFPHQAFDAIACHSLAAVLFRDRKTEASVLPAVAAIKDSEELVATSFCFSEYTTKRFGVQKPLGASKSIGMLAMPAGVCGFVGALYCRCLGRNSGRNPGNRCRFCLAVRRDYGARRARPFARRCFKTRRPALVAMRARKPWVRARLILLGWKVRFICLLPDCLA